MPNSADEECLIHNMHIERSNHLLLCQGFLWMVSRKLHRHLHCENIHVNTKEIVIKLLDYSKKFALAFYISESVLIVICYTKKYIKICYLKKNSIRVKW
jgi:hypothetical protein